MRYGLVYLVGMSAVLAMPTNGWAEPKGNAQAWCRCTCTTSAGKPGGQAEKLFLLAEVVPRLVRLGTGLNVQVIPGKETRRAF
jgi:hypothetical protein